MEKTTEDIVRPCTKVNGFRTSFYPSIAIDYNLKPEHLPDEFCGVYQHQKEARLKFKKGTVENLMYKLALNGCYGKTNSSYSVLYDPLYTLTTVINGQLFLCMLWDKLREIPGTEMIQANTDGITYMIDKKYLPAAKKIEEQWEKVTRMDLEYANYESIFLRDVNNYVAITIPDENGKQKIKAKGCYNYLELFHDPDMDTSGVQWHKNHSAIIVKKAAVAQLLDGQDYKEYIANHKDVFDFFLCSNVNRSSNLLHGEEEVQRNSRYLVTNEGEPLTKLMPPLKGKTEMRRIGINVDYNTQIFNEVTDPNASNYDINFQFYIDETSKLLKKFKI